RRRPRATPVRTQAGAPARASDDLEVPLQFPIRDGVLPLPVFPFARRGVVVDELVAEPVAREVGALEDARRLRERAGRARDVLAALVGALDRPREQLEAL